MNRLPYYHERVLGSDPLTRPLDRALQAFDPESITNARLIARYFAVRGPLSLDRLHEDLVVDPSRGGYICVSDLYRTLGRAHVRGEPVADCVW
jgi:hypothetical protein